LSYVSETFEDQVTVNWPSTLLKSYFVALDHRDFLERKRRGSGIIRRAQIAYEFEYMNPSWPNTASVSIRYLDKRGTSTPVASVNLPWDQPVKSGSVDITEIFAGMGVNVVQLQYSPPGFPGGWAKIRAKVTLWVSYT